jgi:hypothetical protein
MSKKIKSKLEIKEKLDLIHDACAEKIEKQREKNKIAHKRWRDKKSKTYVWEKSKHVGIGV